MEPPRRKCEINTTLPSSPFGLTSHSSTFRCIYHSCKPAPGTPGFTRETDRLAAVGGFYPPALHARYPVRDFVALGSNVCVKCGDAGPEELNSTTPAQNRSLMPLRSSTVIATSSSSPFLLLPPRAYHLPPFSLDYRITPKPQGQMHLSHEHGPSPSTLK